MSKILLPTALWAGGTYYLYNRLKPLKVYSQQLDSNNALLKLKSNQALMNIISADIEDINGKKVYPNLENGLFTLHDIKGLYLGFSDPTFARIRRYNNVKELSFPESLLETQEEINVSDYFLVIKHGLFFTRTDRLPIIC